MMLMPSLLHHHNHTAIMPPAPPSPASPLTLLLGLALVPLYVMGVSLFAAFSLLGLVTGLLPLTHACLLRRDRRRLAALLHPNDGAVVEMVAVSAEKERGAADEPPQPRRRLAVRWSPGKAAGGGAETQQQLLLPPVVLANGLGATLLTIAALHDLLEAAGFPVLSYDRAGVGMSDPSPLPSEKGTKEEEEEEKKDVERTIADMKLLMDRYHPFSPPRNHGSSSG